MKLSALLTSALITSAAIAQAPPPLVAPGTKPTPSPLPATLQARMNLDVTIQKQVSETKQSLANEDNPIQTDPQAYVVTIKNNGPIDLVGARVEYRFFLTGVARAEGGSEPELKRKEGTADLGTLRVGESFTFTTDTFDVPRSVSRGGFYYYVDGSRSRFRSELGGLWMRVILGKLMIMEKAEPASIASREPF